jgi:hypothetical protein
MPARPSDKDKSRDGGILICLLINVEIIIWKVK